MWSRRVIDLSHPLDEHISMFPGLPAPQVLEQLSREDSRSHYAGDTTFVLHQYRLAGNSGTYLDAPFHRYADGDDLAALPLDRAVDLPGIVVDLREPVALGRRAFSPEVLPNKDLWLFRNQRERRVTGIVISEGPRRGRPSFRSPAAGHGTSPECYATPVQPNSSRRPVIFFVGCGSVLGLIPR